MPKTETCNVKCRLSNGLTIRLFEWAEGPLGIKTAVQDGDPVTLKPGDNPGIDAAWYRAWREQNRGSVYVDDNWISSDQDEPETKPEK